MRQKKPRYICWASKHLSLSFHLWKLLGEPGELLREPVSNYFFEKNLLLKKFLSFLKKSFFLYFEK